MENNNLGDLHMMWFLKDSVFKERERERGRRREKNSQSKEEGIKAKGLE